MSRAKLKMRNAIKPKQLKVGHVSSGCWNRCNTFSVTLSHIHRSMAPFGRHYHHGHLGLDSKKQQAGQFVSGCIFPCMENDCLSRLCVTLEMSDASYIKLTDASVRWWGEESRGRREMNVSVGEINGARMPPRRIKAKFIRLTACCTLESTLEPNSHLDAG